MFATSNEIIIKQDLLWPNSKYLLDIFHRGFWETIEEAKEALEGGADINEKDEESGEWVNFYQNTSLSSSILDPETVCSDAVWVWNWLH